MADETELLDHDGILAVLREACAAAGSQRAWARAHDISYRWVDNVLTGATAISQGVVLRLGYRQVTRFERLRR